MSPAEAQRILGVELPTTSHSRSTAEVARVLLAWQRRVVQTAWAREARVYAQSESRIVQIDRARDVLLSLRVGSVLDLTEPASAERVVIMQDTLGGRSAITRMNRMGGL